MDVGEAKIAAAVAVCQPRVVEAEQMQHRRLQVVHVHRLFHGLEPELVGRAVHRAAANAATGHPDREPVVIVVTARGLTHPGARRRKFDRGCPAELAPPEHERAVEHSATDEVVEERADRPITLAGQPAVVGLDLLVAVPGLPGAMPGLHVAHTPLDKPPRDEHLPPLRVVAIAGEHVCRFAGHVERVGRLRLHPPREFHRREPGFECRVVRPCGQVLPIELGDEVELPPLRSPVEHWMADVLHQVGRVALLRVDVRALEGARQEGASPVLRLLDRKATRAHRHEPRRESLREPYRTVIGHIRHELGHYYWDLLVRDTPWIEPFRQVFGDERADYGEALKKHYAEGPAPDWPGRCISSYAASHPWEDWAETWAHYLHIRSTLETATLYRLDISQSPVRVTPFTAEVVRGMPLPPTPPEAVDAFVEWINAWIRLTAVLNETARSMGQPDTYPFVLSGPVVAKMFFVHCVVQGERVAKTAPPPAHSSQQRV